MFTINNDKSIFLTRGDAAVIEVTASMSDNENYIFKKGDVVRFRLMERKQCNLVVLLKDVIVNEEVDVVSINLEREDTKLGEIIHKPKDYWYEVELNPDTIPQTIVGYDSDGPKIFRLFPEGDDYEHSS